MTTWGRRYSPWSLSLWLERFLRLARETTEARMSRRVVWKYAVDLNGGNATFRVPEGARFLHCAAQGGSVGLWFEVTVGQTLTQQRTFRVFGTGDEAIDAHLTYVGTALLSGGAFVFHVYEVSYE